MKAIIIEEKDSKALLNQLELVMYQQHHRHPIKHISTALSHGPHETVTLSDMHGWFHYVVTRWLQEQGASGLKG